MVVLASAALGQGRLVQHDGPQAALPDGHPTPEGVDSRIHGALLFARSAPGVTSALVGMSSVGCQAWKTFVTRLMTRI